MNRHTPKPPLASPWRGGNAFRLLQDGEAFYPAMLTAIQQARHTVLLEMYLVESGRIADRFIDALLAAAHRGVAVYALLDDLGSKLLSDSDRKRLTASPIQLLIYNPLRWQRLLGNVFRDHRKQLTIDGELTYSGGLGISDVFSQEVKQQQAWRETAIEVRGPVVADWQGAFVDNWNHWAERPLQLPPARPRPEAADQHGRLVLTRGGEQLEIKRSLIQAIRAARERVWVNTAYFMPSRKLNRELRLADQRGVDVRLLLPGARTDHPSVRYAGHRNYRRLLKAGVRIFEYQPTFTHVKLALCDDWVSLGSANYDRWSFRWTLEANQEVYDAGFAAQARAQFLTDLSQANEITLYDWLRRPWHQRLREHFWGGVDRLFEFIHHRRRLARRNPFRRR